MRLIADRAFALLGAVVVAIFAAMLALILVQVVNRYMLGFTLFWSEEVIRLLLVWMVMLATPVVLYRHDEIRVVIVSFASPRYERARRLFAALASIAFCAILAYWGYEFTAQAVPARSITLGVSRAWFYVPIPLGAVLAVVALLIRGSQPAAERQSE